MTDDFDPSSLNAYQKAMLDLMDEVQSKAFARLSSTAKFDFMAMHTGQGFVSHDIAPNRPLLPKPLPDYVSSAKMIDILWRRSAWAPIDEMVSFEYAIQNDPEMMDFENWIKGALEKGYLRAYAKINDGPYQDAKIDNPADPDIFIALSKGLEVPCHVRRVGDSYLFSNHAPMDPVECRLWFIRDDVCSLPITAKSVGIGSATRFGQAEVNLIAPADVSLVVAEAVEPAPEAEPERAPTPVSADKGGRPLEHVPYIFELCVTIFDRMPGQKLVDGISLGKITRERLNKIESGAKIPKAEKTYRKYDELIFDQWYQREQEESRKG